MRLINWEGSYARSFGFTLANLLDRVKHYAAFPLFLACKFLRILTRGGPPALFCLFLECFRAVLVAI